MNFTPKMIEKAKNAQSIEELISLAKNNDVELTPEEAKMYFEQLNPQSCELDDDELDNVAGGCGGDSSEPETPADYGFPNGQRVYRPNGVCDKCHTNGHGNPSKNFKLYWHNEPGGRFYLVCEICGGINDFDFFEGDPKIAGNGLMRV